MDCYQLVSLAALLLISSPAFAAPPATETRLTLKVTSVHDGDTFTGINESNEQVKVRLDAVDAPELSQPYGQASKKALGDKLFGGPEPWLSVTPALPRHHVKV